MKIWKVQRSEACGVCPFNQYGYCLAYAVLTDSYLMCGYEISEKCPIQGEGVLVRLDTED